LKILDSCLLQPASACFSLLQPASDCFMLALQCRNFIPSDFFRALKIAWPRLLPFLYDFPQQGKQRNWAIIKNCRNSPTKIGDGIMDMRKFGRETLIGEGFPTPVFT